MLHQMFIRGYNIESTGVIQFNDKNIFIERTLFRIEESIKVWCESDKLQSFNLNCNISVLNVSRYEINILRHFEFIFISSDKNHISLAIFSNKNTDNIILSVKDISLQLETILKRYLNKESI